MNYNIRKLDSRDYSKGYFNLLSQLTCTDNVEFEKWDKRIEEINQNPYHNIFVIEDKGKIIGSITLIIELKIIRKLSKIAHIEDIVVSEYYRGQGIARKLIDYCIEISKNQKCYKIILNCDKKLIPFYNKLGFESKNLQMSIYFNKNSI